MKVGDRVRLRWEVTTMNGVVHPAGSVGVVTSTQGTVGVVGVDMDSGEHLDVREHKLEVYTPVFAGHYQPLAPSPDAGVSILDVDAAEIETRITAAGVEPEEPDYLSITRSFCR